MGPEQSLPISADFSSSEAYVESLLDFIRDSDLLRTLCGGVHILDFFTRDPDIYSVLLPKEWRSFFRHHDIMAILNLFMREDLTNMSSEQWRDGPVVPQGLLTYLKSVRKHCLRRDFSPIRNSSEHEKLARNVALGMKVKKIHEVDHFSRYVEKLTADIADSGSENVSHLVDFGSGQGYLPRCLASAPYNRHVIAVESKQHNIDGARNWDVMAKLAPKPKVMRDKKEWRARQKAAMENGTIAKEVKPDPSVKGGRGFFFHPGKPDASPDVVSTSPQISSLGAGSIQYVEHWIYDGDLSRVVDQIVEPCTEKQPLSDGKAEKNALLCDSTIQPTTKAEDPRLMVISLHSCGNLVHHGLHSLILNPAVSAVALVGCCYNLLTERLGPPTYKLPNLRTSTQRLEDTTASHDPHGFPMSDRLCDYPMPNGHGVRLNITARMMAVQAPYNWGVSDSEAFFTRHFYRALLQRVFLDLGLVAAPELGDDSIGKSSPLGWSGGTQPIVIGSLRKSCYASFVAYVRGVEVKLEMDLERGKVFKEKLCGLTDEKIREYEEAYGERKKELSVIWSLMAFSAGVIEAVVVVDRWLWLKEQQEIEHAWVEPVFDYAQSPRNLVVVGIKK